MTGSRGRSRPRRHRPASTGRSFGELALDALAGRPVDPSRLCRACLPLVGMDRAAVLARVAGGRPETAGASDEVASELSDLQLRCGDGPALESMAQGRPVLVADLARHPSAERWPMFTAAHPGPLTGSLCCLPLQHGAIGVGVLTLARADTRPLAPAEFAVVVDTADTFTTLLLLAGRPDAPGTSSPEQDGPGGPVWPFDNPLTDEVHQATGMVLAQLDVTITEAYLRLRAHAFAHDQPLAEVARAVVSRRLRFTPDPEPPGIAP